jgi:DNA polymerase-3 subunit gamma/tau
MEEPADDLPVPEPQIKPEPETNPEPAKQLKTSTPKISDLKSVLKGAVKKESADPVAEKKSNRAFTHEQLKETWQVFAEKKKVYQATYHLLSQGFEFRDNKVIVSLHNHFQETLLDEIKLDLLTFLRENLGNDTIQLGGEIKTVADDKKVLYTNREKLEHLMEKNPLVKELKDKFSLDTDF